MSHLIFPSERFQCNAAVIESHAPRGDNGFPVLPKIHLFCPPDKNQVPHPCSSRVRSPFVVDSARCFYPLCPCVLPLPIAVILASPSVPRWIQCCLTNVRQNGPTNKFSGVTCETTDLPNRYCSSTTPAKLGGTNGIWMEKIERSSGCVSWAWQLALHYVCSSTVRQ